MLTQEKYNEQLKRKEKFITKSPWRNYKNDARTPKDLIDVKEIKRMRRVKP